MLSFLLLKRILLDFGCSKNHEDNMIEVQIFIIQFFF